MMAMMAMADQRPANRVRAWVQRRAEAMLRKPGWALPELSEPGECQVVLQVIGLSPVPVILAIRQTTGLDLMSAHDLAHDAPVVVVSGISAASAERVVKRLQKAGAKAVANL